MSPQKMGAKASSEGGVVTYPSGVASDSRGSEAGLRSHGIVSLEPGHHRPRSRSLSGVGVRNSHPMVIATSGANDGRGVDRSGPRRRLVGSSVPLHLFHLNRIKCPICSKIVQPDDVELHLVLCMTKPPLSYNDDVLTDSRGECAICFEELDQGDTIARLPCLCIYHKTCIDDWFKVNRSCPEHPGD